MRHEPTVRISRIEHITHDDFGDEILENGLSDHGMQRSFMQHCT